MTAIRNLGLSAFFRLSSALILLGLLVEVISLLWFHPLSFVLFAFLGVTLVGLGILVYLASLIFSASPRAENRRRDRHGVGPPAKL
jgi:hypothetical protein